jgi:epoxyqueuosine reductase
VDKRLAPQLLLEDCRSALVLAVSYAHEPPPRDWKLARYAHGEDYHRWMKKMLEDLALAIRERLGEGFQWRGFVDTGPVLERDLAAKAGLGWIGKNTCLINEGLGSYLFLAVMLTNLDLSFALPEKSALSLNQCASCRLCLEACPTQALTPYQLDASRCLAYHNIERRGAADPDIAEKMGAWVVGCDICQEVCPWNQRGTAEAPLFWREGFARFDLGGLQDLLALDEASYRKKTRDSAISRIKFTDFQRNVRAVAERRSQSLPKDHTQRHPQS